MFFIISKFFTLFLMPFFWLFLCLIWAIFTKKDKNRKLAIKLSFFILMVFGNSYLASKVMRWWEPKPIEILTMSNYDVAIVLGGGIANETKWPNDRVHFDPSADRLLQAIQLYKAGKVTKILISAGSVSLKSRKNEITEANKSKEFLVNIGIALNDILIENKSKNTFENALFSKKILEENKLDKSRIIVITSAYHMKRSLACFHKQGLVVDSFPACYQQLNNNLLSFYTIVPDEDAFALWYDLFHEWYGLVTYKFMGYI